MQYKRTLICFLFSSTIVLCYYLILIGSDNSTVNLTYRAPVKGMSRPNEFKYLLNSDACNRDSSVVHIITSYSGNVETRSAIRRAYPSSELLHLDISRVFLLATLPRGNPVSQSAIINENERFHDLVQGSFIESYRNLTYKHIMGLKWVLENCRNAKYVIKSDDDIMINMYRLVNIIKKERFEMMGYVLKGMRPIRMKANKWYVTKEEYSEDSYPNFLSGWMYVSNITVVKHLLGHTEDLKYFWIDDLFVTGILAQKANIHLSDISEEFSLHPEVVECCLRKGLDCGFSAAPTGGDDSLHLRFQIHSKNCSLYACPKMPEGIKLEDRCVSKHEFHPLHKGSPQITIIN